MQLPGRTLEGIEMYEKGLSVRERLFEKRELRGRELAEPMSNLGTLLKRFDRCALICSLPNGSADSCCRAA